MSDYYFLQANMHLLSDRKLAEMAWTLAQERKLIDKNLRHGAPSARTLHHHRAQGGVQADIGFGKGDALGFQQTLGGGTIAAGRRGVDFDRLHGGNPLVRAEL